MPMFWMLPIPKFQMTRIIFEKKSAMRTLEICCTSVAAALAAQAGGAHRIELCMGLELDGLTPSPGLLSRVKTLLNIPVFVLIRPRGGDFCYSEDEIQTMLSDIKQTRELGADGIVSGALQADGRLHLAHTRLLMEAAGPLPFTFHKAFDVCSNPFEALEALAEMGVSRILTSGCQPNAISGIEMLCRLKQQAGARLSIMCGGGVRAINIEQLAKETGLSEFHSSARPAGAKDTEQEEVSRLLAAWDRALSGL